MDIRCIITITDARIAIKYKVLLNIIIFTYGDANINVPKQMKIGQKLFMKVETLNQLLPIFERKVIMLSMMTVMKNFNSRDSVAFFGLLHKTIVIMPNNNANVARFVPGRNKYGVKHGEIASNTVANFTCLLISFSII